jgi:hypothetical protein
LAATQPSLQPPPWLAGLAPVAHTLVVYDGFDPTQHPSEIEGQSEAKNGFSYFILFLIIHLLIYFFLVVKQIIEKKIHL